MSDNEVLYPQVIDPTPLPSLTGELVMPQAQPSNTPKGEQFTPYRSVAEVFPTKMVAPDVISQSINTMTKQILGEYSFGQMGALAIGTFETGVSGDIRFTPDGITARNVNGITTFSIDGATGNATFLGTLQAGTVVAGDNTVIIEQGGTGGRIVLYNSGVAAIIIGDPT